MEKKKYYSYKELIKAKNILGAPLHASFDTIKGLYIEKIKKFHPDSSCEIKDKEERVKEINNAYEILQEYLLNYIYSFKEEDVMRYNPELELEKQVSGD